MLIFGVGNDGKRVGIAQSLAANFDPVNIGNKVEAKAPGARLETSYFEISSYRKVFGFLCCSPADRLVVFDKEWGFNDKTGQQTTVARPGVLYVRGPGETRPARMGDMPPIVERLTHRGARRLLARIEQVASAPLSSELVLHEPGSDTGVRLVSSDTGQRVRLVEGDSSAVPISEVLDSSIPFQSRQAEFVTQVRLWLGGSTDHSVDRGTLINWYLERDALDMNDDMAEFALRSACSRHSYPMFWASRLDSKRLLDLVEEMLNHPTYPTRMTAPWLVGTFLWERRSELLRPALKRLGDDTGRIAQRVIAAPDRETFFLTARTQGPHIRVDGTNYPKSELLMDPELASQLLEHVMREDSATTDGSFLRTAGYQLDMMVHRPDQI